MNRHVVKRDGQSEAYDEAKVVRVVLAAGLTANEAKLVGAHVTEWIMNSTEATVTSLQIRDELIVLLKTINANAADLYVWYEQTKDKTV